VLPEKCTEQHINSNLDLKKTFILVKGICQEVKVDCKLNQTKNYQVKKK
jgi:hypothetical protein